MEAESFRSCVALHKFAQGGLVMILFKRSFGGTAAAVFIFLAGMSAPALATPISYDEAVDGDIDTIFSTSFNFDVGVNIISGTQAFTIIMDYDFFNFTIASNQLLTGISYAYDPFDIEPNTFGIATNSILTRDSTFFASQIVDILHGGSPVDLFSGDLPLGAGLYQFRQGLFSRLGGGGYWNYTFSFTVVQISPVPLPAALPLFGSALGLFGFAGWRRRRKLESASAA